MAFFCHFLGQNRIDRFTITDRDRETICQTFTPESIRKPQPQIRKEVNGTDIQEAVNRLIEKLTSRTFIDWVFLFSKVKSIAKYMLRL